MAAEVTSRAFLNFLAKYLFNFSMARLFFICISLAVSDRGVNFVRVNSLDWSRNPPPALSAVALSQAVWVDKEDFKSCG